MAFATLGNVSHTDQTRIPVKHLQTAAAMDVAMCWLLSTSVYCVQVRKVLVFIVHALASMCIPAIARATTRTRVQPTALTVQDADLGPKLCKVALAPH